MKPTRFYLLAILIILFDQITKITILKNLAFGESRQAFGKWLVLTHTHNTGSAFSLFPSSNGIFTVIASVAVIALIYAYQKHQNALLIVSASLSLALGGAIGNLIDRIRFGFVVDFFDFHGWTNHTIWPIFNVADAAITCGIFMLAGHFLFAKEPLPTAPAANSAEQVLPAEDDLTDSTGANPPQEA